MALLKGQEHEIRGKRQPIAIVQDNHYCYWFICMDLPIVVDPDFDALSQRDMFIYDVFTAHHQHKEIYGSTYCIQFFLLHVECSYQ